MDKAAFGTDIASGFVAEKAEAGKVVMGGETVRVADLAGGASRAFFKFLYIHYP
jgi:hypothetical protein